MKSAGSFLILFTMASAAFSQGVFTNDVNSALQKVIQDYPNYFMNIKGARVASNLPTVQYYSTVNVPGSLHCVLTQHRTAQKQIYSWDCVLLEAESFQVAKARFSALYDQIKNTIIKIDGEKPFILNGKYEPPCEERKITSVVFQLLPASGNMQRLKVELILQHYVNDWQVTLAVYDQQRRNDEQPELTDRW